jgi:hypothetical protein
MGEYADIEIDRGMNEHFDIIDGKFDDLIDIENNDLEWCLKTTINFPNPNMRFKIPLSIIRETPKAVLITIKEKVYWFPKSHTHPIEDNKYLSVPRWLIERVIK